jgi:hypothetical protein
VENEEEEDTFTDDDPSYDDMAELDYDDQGVDPFEDYDADDFGNLID